jgi:ribosome recycling factor
VSVPWLGRLSAGSEAQLNRADEDAMTTIATTKEAIAAARTRMEKAVDDFRKELATVRTGRANAAILESIRVDFYGTLTLVNQLGNVTVPEPTMLVISPWDPSVVGAIDKAIRASDLGLNPTNDGKVVRVPIPSPTEERRKELVKHIHKVLENHRTAVRNIRRDIKEAIDKLEKDKKISQDEQKRSLDELEKVSHSETKKIEDLSMMKEKEVMEFR